MESHGQESLNKTIFANTGEQSDLASELQLGNLLISAIEHLLLPPLPNSALLCPLNAHQKKKVFSYWSRTISYSFNPNCKVSIQGSWLLLSLSLSGTKEENLLQ